MSLSFILLFSMPCTVLYALYATKIQNIIIDIVSFSKGLVKHLITYGLLSERGKLCEKIAATIEMLPQV
jgi:hypothetical protein